MNEIVKKFLEDYRKHYIFLEKYEDVLNIDSLDFDIIDFVCDLWGLPNEEGTRDYIYYGWNLLINNPNLPIDLFYAISHRYDGIKDPEVFKEFGKMEETITCECGCFQFFLDTDRKSYCFDCGKIEKIGE